MAAATRFVSHWLTALRSLPARFVSAARHAVRRGQKPLRSTPRRTAAPDASTPRCVFGIVLYSEHAYALHVVRIPRYASAVRRRLNLIAFVCW